MTTTRNGSTKRAQSGQPRRTATAAKSTQTSAEPNATTRNAPRPSSPPSSASLLQLVQRDDGWLRIVPERDGGTVYIKWKYSRGVWQGHYLMAVVQYWQMDYGLDLLLDKLANVDDGLKRPTRDTAYTDN